MKKKQPTHGYCQACGGPIPMGQYWTLTKNMARVHSDQDECVKHTKLYPNRK